MHDDFDEYGHNDHPTRKEEKAYAITLDLADIELFCGADGSSVSPRPGHTERCEGCHGSGGGYEDEAWDDEAQDYVPVDFEDCPECGGCGYYDCDGTCEFAQHPEQD